MRLGARIRAHRPPITRLICRRIELLALLDYYPRVDSTTVKDGHKPIHATSTGPPRSRRTGGSIEDDPTRDLQPTTMSIEAAALIAALLWGPTALWLIFRVVRGPGSPRPEAFADRNDQARLVPEALLLDYWVCRDCRSVNHEGANHCYSCGIDRAPVERVKPPKPVTPAPVPTGTGWVAVMDPAPDPRVNVPVVVAAAPAASRPRSRRWNVVGGAPGAFGDASVAAHMESPLPDTVSPGAVAPAFVAPSVAAPAGGARLLPAQSTVPSVCPFIGFKDDAATRCDYPDGRNVCHAAAANAGSATSVPWRRSARSVAIMPDHQSAVCLTAAHRQCARYPHKPTPAATA